MDHGRSIPTSKDPPRVSTRSPKPTSSKSSLSSTWSSTNPSARAKSPSTRPRSPLSPASPTPSSRKNTDFNQTLERMKTYEEKNRFAFERSKQFLEQQQALEALPPPPNPVSRKLTHGLPTLQQRYPDILSSKEKKIETLRLETERRKRESEEKERTSSVLKTQNRLSRSPERFYDYTTQWSKTVTAKTTALRDQIAEKELKHVTFSPHINPTKPSNRSSSPLCQRMSTFLTNKEGKVKAMERSLTPTFTPKTNAAGKGKGKTQAQGDSLRVLKSLLPNWEGLGKGRD